MDQQSDLCAADAMPGVETSSVSNELRYLSTKGDEAFAILSAYKWSYRLSQVCAARLLKPQRLLTLTLDEDKKRVFESCKQWEMCFGHLSWLEKHELA